MREGPRFIGRSAARIRRGAVTTGKWARAGKLGLWVLFPGLAAFAAADRDRFPTHRSLGSPEAPPQDAIDAPHSRGVVWCLGGD